MARGFELPSNETARLAELDSLGIVDANLGGNLDALCELARGMFGIPTATLTILDAETQWRKASAGDFPACSLREDSICTHTILTDEMLVIEDASADARFKDSPFVTMPGGLRFYAGVPIELTPGLPLGAFCIIDNKPRTLSASEATQLKALAGMATTELRLHASALRLEDAEHRFKALVNASVSMVWHMTGRGDITEITMHQAFADAPSALYLGRAWVDQVHPEDREMVLREIDVCLGDHRANDWCTRVLDSTGDYRWLHVRCTPVAGGRQGSEEWIGSCTDIHDRKVAEDRAVMAASHDALTGLKNRAVFHEKLNCAIAGARTAGRQAHLLLVDLDNFKDINDLLGHDAGDEMLCHVADKLTSLVGDKGIVARFGGDEFGVVLTGTDDGVAMDLAEGILRAIEAPLIHKDRQTYCHASIGVAAFPGDGLDPRELFKAADLAMYGAKGKGRNQACRFESRMRSEMIDRVRVVSNVREALAHGRIVPYYQPKVSLTCGRVTGFEALARWRHPVQGLLTPGAFSAAFDDVDVSLGIGEAMLAGVLDDIVVWRDRGIDVGRVAINLSTSQFYQPDLAESILGNLERRGLHPSLIEIEVTETVYLHRSNVSIARTLGQLHAAGVAISLDDFGTGFASLTHLKQFPIDRVKIDRSFVSDIERASEDAAIVRAITGLGHTLGMTVIAEGVETLGQAIYLQGAGCDEAQGFLYAKAMPASRVPHFIGNWDPTRVTGATANAELLACAS